MEHIGIDLGARQSHLVVVSAAGEVKQRLKVATKDLPGFLSGLPQSHVVMEACTQSPAVARAAQASGHATKVVAGQLVRLLGVGARGIKTDERDAQALALASLRNPDLPSVHLRGDSSQQRRELLQARSTLVRMRAQIGVSVKSWLRGQLVVLAGRASSAHFSQAVRDHMAKNGQELPLATQTLLTTYEQLCAQLEVLDKEIEQLVDKDETCQRLMTIPGVGPQVALGFMTQVDDPKRFASADALASYLALSPGEATTGGKVVRTSTIKAGPRHLKALLVQAAWSMYRARPNDPAVLWMQRIADKRGKRIAVVALARKLATVMWSMWKHETRYESARASTVRHQAATSSAQTLVSLHDAIARKPKEATPSMTR